MDEFLSDNTRKILDVAAPAYPASHGCGFWVRAAHDYESACAGQITSRSPRRLMQWAILGLAVVSFVLLPVGSWAQGQYTASALYNFCPQSGCPDGGNPTFFLQSSTRTATFTGSPPSAVPTTRAWSMS